MPAPVIAAAIRKGGLVYRTDLSDPDIQPDLRKFESELLGAGVPDFFYRP